MMAVHKRSTKRAWIHKGCGGEVVYESATVERDVVFKNGVLIEDIRGPVLKEGYRCEDCGFIPKSEVKRATVEFESWESTDDFEPLLFDR